MFLPMDQSIQYFNQNLPLNSMLASEAEKRRSCQYNPMLSQSTNQSL